MRGTNAIIDLDAIGHNLKVFRGVVGPAVALMAVVKAGAYGHGAIEVARAAVGYGADWLGVATAEEGTELRMAGIEVPILVLGASNADQVRLALAQEIDVTVFERFSWEAIKSEAHRQGIKPRVHLKVDTGMGRVGVHPSEVVSYWIPQLTRGDVIWPGLMSHLAESDADDPAFTRRQLTRFLDVIEQIRLSGTPLPPTIHLANSAAALRYPGTHFNLVRIGIGLYGAEPYPGATGLKPAMRLESRVTMVKRLEPGDSVGYGRTYVLDKPASIATVAVGYADGYRRALSNRAFVLIRGRRCPVVGRISMDQATVQVPDDLAVQAGDRVILLGCDGDAKVAVEEWAEWAGTISYEVLTGISPRVPRRYLASRGDA